MTRKDRLPRFSDGSLGADGPAETEMQSQAGHRSASEASACEYCPNCSQKLIGRQCQLICTRCGYFLSCSDYD